LHPIHNVLAVSHRRRVPRAADQPATGLLTALLLSVAAAVALWPVLQNGFVNWDDPAVLIENAKLTGERFLPWAFTTTLMGHYQPLGWLIWGAIARVFGLSPTAFHAVSLAGHAVNGVLVYAVVRRLTANTALGDSSRRATALASAGFFALHPVQVEPIAWASAMPYIFSATALLLATLAYLHGRRPFAVVLYGVSLLTRATALGFPMWLLILDFYPLARQRSVAFKRLLVEKAPFAMLAGASAFVEWRARDVASLQEIGVGARATLAATAPFVYLGRLVAPLRLTPLDPLPIAATARLIPLAAALIGLLLITVAAWRLRDRWPILAAVWIAYVVGLAPVAGLTPSGLQATADRYLYLPVAILAIPVGLALARAINGRFAAATLAIAIAIGAGMGLLTWKQTQYWHDSVTLWTRAADIDPRNDVATYNLAVALAAAGREDEAADAYRRTIALVPDHDLARHHLAVLQASRAEREADQLAGAGRTEEAAAQYTRALQLDDHRPHAHAALGTLLARQGHFEQAAAELDLALKGGVTDVEVPNTLAFALRQLGNDARAAEVLDRALAAHAGDVNLEHNLARLLATSADPQARNAPRAVQLALDVCERTRNRDARALDTLAAAYAANGQFDLARTTAARAVARAREIGDAAIAAEIADHAAAYGALTRSGVSRP
jgi:tetratricopeptide (TPR) repeat protein